MVRFKLIFCREESLISGEEVTAIAARAGLKLPSHHLEDWSVLLSGLNHCAKEVLALEDYYPKVDLDLYPRTNIHRPEGIEATAKGGWAWKATVKAMNPTSDLLKGVRVTLKDNIALAGVQCTNGTGAVDWIPDVDATLTTRILDAGAIITGKAACENNCFGAVSDTSVTGPVHNPFADGYSCGGSSSGSARLVAIGECDVSVGADQGGSIRLPSANCGLVGLKPTWGLVPYTGVISLEATIDHVGPMARTTLECATLLEVIAGSDGIDDRQPYNLAPGSVKYSEEIKTHLNIKDQPLKGIKIGVLEEGYQDPSTDPNVAATSRAAIEQFKVLGAEVKPVSIPLHKESNVLWMVALPMAGLRQGFLGFPTGRKQLLFPDRATKIGAELSQEAFDSLGPGGQNIYLRGLFLGENFGAPLQARCTNLLRKLNDEYDRALQDVDVLVMPTIIFPPVKLRKPEQMIGQKEEMSPLTMLSRTIGATYNTSNFNSTGHPGLNLPVGFVPAQDDPKVKLPTGLQIVGRKFEDLTCLKIAASWEQSQDWKTFTC